MKRVDAVVAAPVGKQQRVLVDDRHKSRLAAARRGVEAPFAVRGGHDHERGQLDEPATMSIEAVELLAQRALLRRRVERAQIRAGDDLGHRAIVTVSPVGGGTGCAGAPLTISGRSACGQCDAPLARRSPAPEVVSHGRGSLAGRLRARPPMW
jgi:hypothetical protein